MNAADYIVDYLTALGVTHAFGIPGGVILDLLYAMSRRASAIEPHLTYHEQGAVFAACGYAQIKRGLGVAYATRGPGVTNMVTGIADAYYDSVPLLVLTGHNSTRVHGTRRIAEDQEMDPLPLVANITKYAARVEGVEALRYELEKACRLATTGRQGPVLLDIHKDILGRPYSASAYPGYEPGRGRKAQTDEAAGAIKRALAGSRRPLILVGDGVKQAGGEKQVAQLAEKIRVPVLSSRAGEDVMPLSPLYLGYIGSHGIRYANFVLAKADLVIALGNRLSFPTDSASYRPLIEKLKIIRTDVDEIEFERRIPNCSNYVADTACLVSRLEDEELSYQDADGWLAVCRELKAALQDWDVQQPVGELVAVLRSVGRQTALVADVGNHEFWLSRAYVRAEVGNRLLFSKSFGTLGCALPKAIGAHYATGKGVVCFAGDQGLQMNIQELQFISTHRLPVKIVLINNHSSGMIRSREKEKYGGRYVHTTLASGYSVPVFQALAEAYGVEYGRFRAEDREGWAALLTAAGPAMIEMDVDEEIGLEPILPRGNGVQRLWPPLPEDLYEDLDKL